MRLLSPIFLSGIIFLLSLTSTAADLDFQTQQTDIRSFIALGLDNSTFDVNGAQIKGFGGKIDFSHYLSDKVNLQVFISSAINQQNSVASSFTGFGGYLFYSVLGSCCKSKKLTSVSGAPVISENRPQENTLNVGAGIDQYMLYGTSSVYPASGLGFSGNYIFNALNLRWKIEGRFSNLSIGSTIVKGTSFGFGVVIPM